MTPLRVLQVDYEAWVEDPYGFDLMARLFTSRDWQVVVTTTRTNPQDLTDCLPPFVHIVSYKKDKKKALKLMGYVCRS